MAPSIARTVALTLALAVSALSAVTNANAMDNMDTAMNARPTDNCLIEYKVKDGDTCNAIVEMHDGLTLPQLFAWNPQVDYPSCDNLRANELVCIRVLLRKDCLMCSASIS